MFARFCIAIVVVVSALNLALAQQPSASKLPSTAARSATQPMQALSSQAASAQAKLIDESFFSPELIMQHQKAIGLTAEQQAAIRAEMQKMVARFTDLQWQDSAEIETMAALLKQDRPDEKEVLTQLDKLLNIENEIKRLHTGALVRMKNILTAEQQGQLRGLNN